MSFMSALQEVLAEVPEEVADGAKGVMLAEWNRLADGAMDRQRAIAQGLAREDLAAVDGLGELSMSVDAQIYHFWNWKLPGCWADKEFRDWFKRNFPETVVRCKGSRSTTVLMPGLGMG
jgi:hypothetical protein